MLTKSSRTTYTCMLYTLALLLVSTLFVPASADDQFVCCMRGIRSIRNIRFCPAPCCEGYEEKVVYPAKLARISYCVKMPQKKLRTKVEQMI